MKAARKVGRVRLAGDRAVAAPSSQEPGHGPPRASGEQPAVRPAASERMRMGASVFTKSPTARSPDAHGGGRLRACAHLLGELEPLELHVVGGPRGHER